MKYLLVSLIPSMILLACGQHAPVRESANATNNAYKRMRLTEIAVAEGTFVGDMVLTKNNQHYRCTLLVQHFITPTTSNGTDPLEVATLTGNLQFDVFKNYDPRNSENFPDLMTYLGGRWTATLSKKGNFNSSTNELTLPYAVGTDESFGEFVGTFSVETGHFIGKWHSQGAPVAYFDLRKL